MKRLTVVLAVVLLGLTGCGFGSSGLLIGATNFTESRIMANIYAVALENVGLNITVKELGTRDIVDPALEKNQLQIAPEYLADFADYLNARANGPDAPLVSSNNVEETYAAAKKLAAPVGITVLTPSKAQDQNAFAVLASYSAQHNLKTLSQLATFSQTNSVILGGGPECPTRPTCELGLEQVYGIKFAGFVSLDSGGPLTIQALKQEVIQVGVVFSSSGLVIGNDLVVLEDDKNMQPAGNLVPIVNSEAVTPQITETLDAISAKMTTADLRLLNAQVDIERQDPRTVAKNWLTAVGLLGASPSATTTPRPTP